MNIKYFFLIVALPFSVYSMNADVAQLQNQITEIEKSTQEMKIENDQFKLAIKDCEASINNQKQIEELNCYIANIKTMSDKEFLVLVERLLLLNKHTVTNQ